MTEKEKMLKGLLYDANYDSDLLIQRRECQTKCFHYNHIPPFELEKRTEQIKKILFQTGENICIDGGMTKQMIYHEDCGWCYTKTSDTK